MESETKKEILTMNGFKDENSLKAFEVEKGKGDKKASEKEAEEITWQNVAEVLDAVLFKLFLYITVIYQFIFLFIFVIRYLTY